jgi:hypothetical protein
MRVGLIGLAGLPCRRNDAETRVFENELIDVWIGLVGGRRFLSGNRARRENGSSDAKRNRQSMQHLSSPLLIDNVSG